MVATQHSGGGPLNSGLGANTFRWKSFAVLAVVFLAAAAYDVSDGILFLGDIDDRLRAVQVRQMLSGKGWFDLSLTGIAMPGPYVSPWSRLIDAPYAAIAWIMSLVVVPEQALAIAFNVWPPVLMLAFAWFSAGSMEKLMPEGKSVAPLHALVAALAMIYASLEFVPGRIDHHNAQLVTLAAASYGVLCWSVAGGILTAGALALSVTIGLETLPLIAVLWSALALAWIVKSPNSDKVFRAFSVAIVILVPLVTLVFSGPGVLLSVENDVFSAPYVAAFAGFGVTSAFAASVLPVDATPRVRFATLAVGGSLLLGLVVISMPGILAGPYAIIDPVSRKLWLEHVDQEHSVLLLVRAGLFSATFNLALQAAIALGSGMLAWRSFKAGEAGAGIVLAMGVAAFVANLDAFRFIRFPAAILPLFIPQLLDQLASNPLQQQKKLVTIFGMVALGFGIGFQVISITMPVQREPGTLDAADFLMDDTCTAADRKAMKALPPGNYMVTPAMGLTLLDHAPTTVSVADISYHRASPGMRRMFDALYFSDPSARKTALAPFEYVAFCAYPAATKARFSPPPGSIFEALLNDSPVTALVPQAVPASRHLKLYRIDHDRL